MHIDIDVFVEMEMWHDAITDIQSYSTKIIENILKHNINKKAQHIEISIVLSGNNAIQKLNKTYRNKDKPTNVLSFPQTTAADIYDMHTPIIHLGDIIIAYETIAQESKVQNKDIRDHYTHMLVHGCLHLLHYDHETDEDAKEMEALEIEILHAFGIKNPYETDTFYGRITT